MVEEPAHDPRCCGMFDGRLLPPPKDNMLGPAAYHPYLRPGAISCRPGGPYLYDLLDELPMKDFGVLAWSIIDREEEIFELEDVPDEDKVMLALWNRWIALHRYEQRVFIPIATGFRLTCSLLGWNSFSTGT